MRVPDEIARFERVDAVARVKVIAVGPAIAPPTGRIEIVAEVAFRFVGAGTVKTTSVSETVVTPRSVAPPWLGVHMIVDLVRPAPVTVMVSPPPTYALLRDRDVTANVGVVTAAL